MMAKPMTTEPSLPQIIDRPSWRVTIRSDRICEIVIKEGVDLNLQMHRDMARTVHEALGDGYGLLIDRQYSYSYAFDCFGELGRFPGAVAMAILLHKHEDLEHIEHMRAITGTALLREARISTNRNELEIWLRARVADAHTA
ncbi:MAG: hypothetical protein ACYTF0_00800 [Planctomycetota bacterium]|jgi:hypothetical protein